MTPSSFPPVYLVTFSLQAPRALQGTPVGPLTELAIDERPGAIQRVDSAGDGDSSLTQVWLVRSSKPFPMIVAVINSGLRPGESMTVVHVASTPLVATTGVDVVAKNAVVGLVNGTLVPSIPG